MLEQGINFEMFSFGQRFIILYSVGTSTCFTTKKNTLKPAE